MLVIGHQKCAEIRKKQLAQSKNVVECRRPPGGEMKFAVGMVVRPKNVPDFNGFISCWSLYDEKNLVGYTEGVRTRRQTHRKPHYMILVNGIQYFLEEGSLISVLFQF